MRPTQILLFLSVTGRSKGTSTQLGTKTALCLSIMVSFLRSVSEATCMHEALTFMMNSINRVDAYFNLLLDILKVKLLQEYPDRCKNFDFEFNNFKIKPSHAPLL